MDAAAAASGAERLVAACHEARQFTDIANFTLRCGVCQIGLKGEKEAVEHAKTTGHQNFAGMVAYMNACPQLCGPSNAGLGLGRLRHGWLLQVAGMQSSTSSLRGVVSPRAGLQELLYERPVLWRHHSTVVYDCPTASDWKSFTWCLLTIAVIVLPCTCRCNIDLTIVSIVMPCPCRCNFCLWNRVLRCPDACVVAAVANWCCVSVTTA